MSETRPLLMNPVWNLAVTPLGDGSLTTYSVSTPPVVTTTFSGGSGYLVDTVGDILPVFTLVLSGDGTIESAVLVLSGGSVVFTEVASSGSGRKIITSSTGLSEELEVLAEFVGRKVISNGAFNSLVEIEAEFASGVIRQGGRVISLLVQASGAGDKLGSASSVANMIVSAYGQPKKLTGNGSSVSMVVDEYVSTVPIHWGNAIIFVPIQALGEGEGIHPPLVGMQLKSCITQKINLKSEILQWQSFC